MPSSGEKRWPRHNDGSRVDRWPDQWMLRDATGRVSHLSGGPVKDLDPRYDQALYVPAEHQRDHLKAGVEAEVGRLEGEAGGLSDTYASQCRDGHQGRHVTGSLMAQATEHARRLEALLSTQPKENG